jgi:hypothetical protein
MGLSLLVYGAAYYVAACFMVELPNALTEQVVLLQFGLPFLTHSCETLIHV